MSVQSGPTFKRYAANGVTTVYAIPFLLLDAADLLVTLDGGEVVSGFVLTGVGNPSSTCTFSAAPTGDLLFQLSIPFQRLADYQNNGDLLSSTLNNDFDRLWLAIKQLSGGNDRALSTGVLEPEGISALPVAASRALKLLAFDELSNPVTSTLTIYELEQQPALASAAAAAASASAVAAAASETNAASSAAAAAASAAFAGDPWVFQPIGVPIAVFDHIAGVSAPPTTGAYRYIKLTASDAYNTGILTGESVSGSAPLVLATAVISLAGSPLNGRTVQLINTERRSIRAGSSGAVEQDAAQGHRHKPLSANATAIAAFVPSGGANTLGAGVFMAQDPTTGDAVTDGVNGAPRTANETRSKNIGATYYMRIK